MIIPMSRLRIAAPKKNAGALIKDLYGFGCFHINHPATDPVLRKSGLPVGIFPEESAKILTEAESLLEQIQSALAVLPKPAGRRPASRPRPVPGKEWLSGESMQRLRSSTGEILALSQSADRLRRQLNEVSQYRRMFEVFLPLIEMVVSSTSVELMGVTFPKGFEAAFKELEAAMDGATDGAFSIFRNRESEAGNYALLVYPASLREKILRQVIGKKAQPVHLPEAYRRKTFAVTIKCLFEKEKTLVRDLEKESRELAGLAEERLDLLTTALEAISHESRRLRTQYWLAHSRDTFWVSGWIPEEESAKLAEALEGAYRGAVLSHAAPPGREEYEETPVKLKNAGWVAPFERFLSFYGLPLYGTVDPSLLVALTFPLFFGLMMGDAGYAALLACAGYFIKCARPRDRVLRDVASIIFRCSLATLLFGILYGELFGKLWETLGLPHALFNRKEEPMALLSMVLYLGLGHSILGSSLGAMNALRLGSVQKAVEKFCDGVLLLSLLWAVTQPGTLQGSPWFLIAPVSAFLIKLAVGRFMEVVTEMPRLFSSILSYARLMALGLASVIMADLADDLLGSDMWIGCAFMICLLVHFLNFIIGVFSPAIQAARLHYVEFFSQFYARGTPFAPLTP